MSKSLAPICLFTFNRPELTKITIEHLSNNFLAKDSELFIFCDGPRNEDDEIKNKKVHEIIDNIKGFKKIYVYKNKKNIGLANSIISGVSDVISKYGRVIVIEDDLVTSKNFLNYMNQALDYYKNVCKVFSISGFGHKLKLPQNYNYDIYFRARPYSWGWATWNDRWALIDWEIKDFQEFNNDKKKIQEFNKNGADSFKMLINSIKGKNNSWAIRFSYNQFIQNKFTVSPIISKIENIGYGSEATHCVEFYNRHKIKFDQTNKIEFIFNNKVVLNKEINKQLKRYNSIRQRIVSKLMSFLIKIKIIRKINNVEYVKK